MSVKVFAIVKAIAISGPGGLRVCSTTYALFTRISEHLTSTIANIATQDQKDHHQGDVNQTWPLT